MTQNSRNADVPIVHSQGTQFTVQLVRPFSACRRQGGSHGQCFQLVLDWGCGIKETMMISSNFMALFVFILYLCYNQTWPEGVGGRERESVVYATKSTNMN